MLVHIYILNFELRSEDNHSDFVRNETLRMYPPVLTNGPREVGAGAGRVIAGRYVVLVVYLTIPPPQ